MVISIKSGSSKKSILKKLALLAEEKKSKGVDVFEFLGKINLKKDALSIQKEMRNDW